MAEEILSLRRNEGWDESEFVHALFHHDDMRLEITTTLDPSLSRLKQKADILLGARGYDVESVGISDSGNIAATAWGVENTSTDSTFFNVMEVK